MKKIGYKIKDFIPIIGQQIYDRRMFEMGLEIPESEYPEFHKKDTRRATLLSLYHIAWFGILHNGLEKLFSRF